MWVRIREPQPRSVFWVVSTHVLTTAGAFGLITAVLFAVQYGGFEHYQPLPPGVNRIIMVVSGAVSMWLTVRYSFGYLRGRGNVKLARPPACVVPSIAAFAGLGIGMYILLCYAVWRGMIRFDWAELAWAGTYTLIAISVFSWLTWREFERLPRDDIPGFEVQPPSLRAPGRERRPGE